MSASLIAEAVDSVAPGYGDIEVIRSALRGREASIVSLVSALVRDRHSIDPQPIRLPVPPSTPARVEAKRQDVRLLPAQMEFVVWGVDDSHDSRLGLPMLLYSGAWAAGKTRALCYLLAMRASVPGAREVLVRRHLEDLKRSTLVTLLEGDGDMPPILPPGTYRWNKQDHRIWIDGGGEIVYMGASDSRARSGSHKIGSLNVTGAAVDEWAELSPEDNDWLISRVRLNTKGIGHLVYGATNPGGPGHHLAGMFGIGSAPIPNRKVIHAPTTSNVYLPRAYVETLNRYQGTVRARYVQGLWVGNAERMVYPRWSRVDMSRAMAGLNGRNVLGVDDGFANPFAVVRIQHWAGNAHVDMEYSSPGMTEESKIDRITACCNALTERVLIDPAGGGASLIERARSVGIPAEAADKDVLGGISCVDNLMGSGRFSVDPSCRRLMEELETYEWSEGGEKPVKSNDHLCDALRYALSYLFRKPGEFMEFF